MPDTRPLSPSLWIAIALGAVALVGLLHAVFPRYDVRAAGADGHVIIVYDKWSGRIQRATYDEKGKLTVMDVYTPF